MKSIVLFVASIVSTFSTAEIPDWYKRDIVKHLKEANAVILYRVKNVQYQSKQGPYYSYRIDTETLEGLKGNAPSGECYFIHTEGEWDHPYEIGEERMVILNIKYTGECGAIEPGFAALATEEYVSLFKSIIG